MISYDSQTCAQVHASVPLTSLTSEAQQISIELNKGGQIPLCESVVKTYYCIAKGNIQSEATNWE